MTSPPSTQQSEAGGDNLHVVHYIAHLREEEGGVVRSVLDISRVLADHGCRVTILTADTERLQQAATQDGIQVIPIEFPSNPFASMSADSQAVVERTIASATVVHLHTLWDARNLRMAKLARQQRTPYVVSTHGMLDDYAISHKGLKKQIYLALFGRQFLHGAALLHCSASHERSQALTRAPQAEVFVAPLAFDINSYTELPGPELAESQFECLDRPETKLLFLSRVNPIKGPDVLIEAMAKLKHRDDLHAVMAGPGDEPYVAQLKALATKLGVADRFSYVGMVSGELKQSLYQACDLYVLPTRQENFGMVFAEALACELPIVTTETVDTADELRQGGVMLVPRNAEAFAEAIDSATGNLEQLARLGESGREYVLQWLNTAAVAEQYKGMYRQAAQSSN